MCSYKVGTLNAAESPSSPEQHVHVMYDHVPHKLVPPRNSKRTKWVFISSVGLSKQLVERYYDEGANSSTVTECHYYYYYYKICIAHKWKHARVGGAGVAG